MELTENKNYPAQLFDRYLRILGIEKHSPTLQNLQILTASHLCKIPFENVLKLYKVKVQNIREYPDLYEYLDNIENNNFGGTCFTNNYYINLLMNYLGYDVKLCSADIAVASAASDSHMLNVVLVDGREVVVDVGYGAPFWKAFYRDSDQDIAMNFGLDKYVLKPENENGCNKLEVYHNEELVHGYLLKPFRKTLIDFQNVIHASYQDSGTFINRLVFVKFDENKITALRNNKITMSTPNSSQVTLLQNRQDIQNALVQEYKIPSVIAQDVVSSLDDTILFGT